MNRHTLLLFLVNLLLSCSDSNQIRQLMDDAESRNRRYESMANDSAMFEVAKWMDRNGTENECMRAHYLLAAVYRDRGQAPEALEELQKATQCANTADRDCDYHTLSRVHGQMAELFYDQLLPHEMLEELALSYKYAKLDNDTITWLCAYELKNDAFYLMGQYDSAINVLRTVYVEYMTYGYKERAIQSLRNLILYLTENGNLSEAKQIIDLYEKESGYFVHGDIEQGRELYYYLKANYYLKSEQTDTAELYLRKISAVMSDEDGNMKEAVYKGLHKVYLKQGNRDSISKYANLSYQINDENYQSSSTEQLRKMQALYNYNHHREEAHKKELDAYRNHIYFTIASALCLLIILLAIVFVVWQKKKKKRQMQKLHDIYDHQISQMEKEKTEILRIKDNEYQTLLHDKEREIGKRQEIIDGLNVIFSQDKHKTLEARLADSKEYKRFLFLANHPLEKMQKEDRKALCEMIDRELPSFYSLLHSNHQISEEDYFFCILIRLHFSPTDIRILLGMQMPNISRKCKHLLQKWYEIEGTPNDFKNIIKNIR